MNSCGIYVIFQNIFYNEDYRPNHELPNLFVQVLGTILLTNSKVECKYGNSYHSSVKPSAPLTVLSAFTCITLFRDTDDIKPFFM